MIPLSIMSSMLKSLEDTPGAVAPSGLNGPSEVQTTVAEIDAFLDKQASLCRDVIRRDAVTSANEQDKTVHSIRHDGLQPDHLALILITNVLGNRLTSGHYHVYRGVLSAIGDDMLNLWGTAVSAMHQRGYYSDDEAQEDMRWIQAEINNVG